MKERSNHEIKTLGPWNYNVRSGLFEKKMADLKSATCRHCFSYSAWTWLSTRSHLKH